MQQQFIGTQALPVMRPVVVPQLMSAQGLGHTAYHHLGGITDDAWNAARLAAVGFATYHGYTRNKGNLPWTLVWALCAFISPVVTTGVAAVQHYKLLKRI